MDYLGDLGDIHIKEPQGVRVGQHQGRHPVVHLGPQVIQGNAAVFIRGHLDDVHAHHGGAGRVGAVGRVGDQDDLALAVPPGLVVSDDQFQAGVLPVGPGHRLQGHRIHAGDFRQVLFQFVGQLQGPLGALFRGQGMEPGKTGQPAHRLIDLGVVLHGTGPQGVKAVVHAVVEQGKVDVVADDISFADFRQGRCFPAQQTGRQELANVLFRHVARGQGKAHPAGDALFKDEGN